MKEFGLYTLARLGLFVAAFAAVWFATAPWLAHAPNRVLWVALFALIISAILSWIFLRRLRDRFAARIGDRASRMNERIERSRSAEDID